MESENPMDMHIYMVCHSQLQSFTKFCWAVPVELRWRTVWSSIFNFCQISKYKNGHYSQKKIESKFPVVMHIYTLCPSLLQSSVPGNSVEQFQRSCAENKNRTDGLTGWLTDWRTCQKHYTLRNSLVSRDILTLIFLE